MLCISNLVYDVFLKAEMVNLYCCIMMNKWYMNIFAILSL